LFGPGFIVTTRKIAARVSGADTGCATAIASISQRSFELAFDRSGQWLQRFARRLNQLYLCHRRLVFVKPESACVIGTASAGKTTSSFDPSAQMR
jgi:hypothetical protein